MKCGILRLFTLALLGVLVVAVPVRGDEVSNEAMQDEIRALKEMVLELQKRIQHLEAERANLESKKVSAQEPEAEKKRARKAAKKARKPPAKGGLDHLPSKETKEKETAQGMLQKKAPPKVGEKPPAPLELAGHEVRVGIEGAIQADVIHDFNAVGLSPGDGVPREFITAYIPAGGPAAEITNRTALSPNQSYLTGWAETDTPWGPLRVYGNVNLFGSTTEAEFEIYKAYGQWGWLKAGLDYSIWLNQAAIPNTLDFEGPNAAPETRFTQASLKIPFRPSAEKKAFFFTVGVEDADGDMTLPQGTSSVNQIPSVIGKLSYEPGWTQMELAGMYRRLRAQGTDYDQSVNGWGVSFSGSVDTWGHDSFVWGIEYGRALGAYIQDTAGLGLDAAPESATNSHLKAIPAFGFWAGYQHWWNKALRSSATYGFVNLDSDFNVFPQPSGTGTYKQTHYASLNLVWSPWPPFDVGLEYMYGQRTVTDPTAVDGGTTGSNHRLQFTMRWNFDWER